MIPFCSMTQPEVLLHCPVRESFDIVKSKTLTVLRNILGNTKQRSCPGWGILILAMTKMISQIRWRIPILHKLQQIALGNGWIRKIWSARDGFDIAESVKGNGRQGTKLSVEPEVGKLEHVSNYAWIFWILDAQGMWAKYLYSVMPWFKHTHGKHRFDSWIGVYV